MKQTDKIPAQAFINREQKEHLPDATIQRMKATETIFLSRQQFKKRIETTETNFQCKQR